MCVSLGSVPILHSLCELLVLAWKRFAFSIFGFDLKKARWAENRISFALYNVPRYAFRPFLHIYIDSAPAVGASLTKNAKRIRADVFGWENLSNAQPSAASSSQHRIHIYIIYISIRLININIEFYHLLWLPEVPFTHHVCISHPGATRKAAKRKTSINCVYVIFVHRNERRWRCRCRRGEGGRRCGMVVATTSQASAA